MNGGAVWTCLGDKGGVILPTRKGAPIVAGTDPYTGTVDLIGNWPIVPVGSFQVDGTWDPTMGAGV